MLKEVSFTESSLVRSVCQESLFEFTKEFWPVVSKQTPVWNWHIRVLCNEMQRCAERVFRNLPNPYDIVINIPPGTTKSTVVSEMFPAWVWTRMPSAQFICGSHTYTIAHELARRSKDVVASPKYQAAFNQDNQLTLKTDAIDQFINQAGGWRLAVGAGAVTGYHGHFILIDDPIDPLSTKSVADREKAVDWMKGTLSTRKVDKIVTPTILVMQRLNQGDPSGLMLGEIRDMSWGTPVRHICLPWKLSPLVKPEKYRAYYDEETGLLDPIRFPEKSGEEYRIKLGKFGFACQMEQNPVPLEGGLIKVEKFRYEHPVPLVHFKKLVRFWDKAGTHQGGKRTAGVLLGLDGHKRIWVLDVIIGQWSAGDREKVIKDTALRDGNRVTIGIEQEPGSGGKESAENTVRNLMGMNCTVQRPTGDKEWRADPFAAMVDIGNVFVRADAAWIPEYVEELRYFPNGTFSDQTDATSGAFNLIAGDNVHMGAVFRRF